MLLEILRTLEGLPAKMTSMRLQRNVNTNVRSDMVTFYRDRAASAPCADESEVVGRLATDVMFADMILARRP